MAPYASRSWWNVQCLPASWKGRKISQFETNGAKRGRHARAHELIAAEPVDGPVGLVSDLHRLCRGLTTALAVRGVVVSLMSEPETSGVAAASDDHCKALEELQFTTGEGPCHDAFLTRKPILIPDLTRRVERWPGYVSAGTAAGVAAIFAFPLHVGAIGFGVLSVVSDRSGSLSDDEVSMALTFAQIATDLLLGNATTAEGQIDPGLESALSHRSEIYQAQGMVTVALDVSLLEALVRMRAHAFSHDQPLIDLAREIINDARRLDQGL